jgi:hypothetical protein
VNLAIDIMGRGETEVWSVGLTILGPLSGPRPSMTSALDFFEPVAELPVRSRPELAGLVRGWTRANIGLTTDAYFDRAEYAYSVESFGYGLDIVG